MAAIKIGMATATTVDNATIMENRYTNGQAAERIGVTKNTLYRWEIRKAAGDPKYTDFPAPRRVAHSNHRFYTDADIERIIQWKSRTIEPAA